MAVCVYCSKEFKPHPQSIGKYCSCRCQADHRQDTKVSLWLQGGDKGWIGSGRKLKEFIRTYLHRTRGTHCSECGWDDKHPSDNSTLTEIDHIDGDCENCSEDNLRVLCPNCHSKTPTYRNRNKSSKRER